MMLSNSTAFTKLPQELTTRILQFCTYQDILRFSETCKAYRELVLNATNLQLQIELEVNRLQLSSDYMRGNQQELLQELKSYNNNWLNLSLDAGPTTKIARYGRSLHDMMGELCGGLFPNVYSRSIPVQERSDWQADTVEIIPLDEPTSSWTHTFDVTFHQLAMDPDQDLLILAVAEDEKQNTLTVHFYSLKTGLAHPCAQHPVIVLALEFSVKPPVSYYSPICISVIDEVLAVNLISHNPSPWSIACDVLILDWRNGCLLHHIGSRHGFCSAVCLDEDRLAVFAVKAEVPVPAECAPRLNSITLLLFDQFRVPRSERLSEDLNIFNVFKSTVLAPALALDFPILNKHPDLMIRVGGFRASSASTPSGTTSGKKFTPSPSCQTLSLTLRTITMFQSPHLRAHYVIALDVQRILHHLSCVPPQAPTDPLPWSAWGEAATRWNKICVYRPPYPMSKTYGSRLVTARQPEDDGFTGLVVADFNPVLARRSKLRDLDREGLYLPDKGCDTATDGEWSYLEADPETRRIVVDYVDETRPTVLEGVSKDPIISRLPYRVTVVGEPPVAFDDWMIDGNRLVGIKVCIL